METKLDLKIMDDLTTRFLINSEEFMCLNPEEYFFILEEAQWFYLDFYKSKGITLFSLAQQLLAHNNIKVAVASDYEKFKKYKQSIKVYGAMMFNSDMSKVLVVEQLGMTNTITFPKGKKSKNETGIECAIREVYEEVNYEISDKIVDVSVTVFDKITFYCVFNVDMKFPFKTNTRNEIAKIFWFDLDKFETVKNNPAFKIFVIAYQGIEKKIKEIKEQMFKFNLMKINEKIKLEA